MTAIPTLTRIRTWDTDHLRRAADFWARGADHWESVFTAVYQGSARPGGHRWEGSAADAAQLRAYLDRMAVIGAADRVRAAAEAARTGAGEIDAAKQRALEAVGRATNAGFVVGEDLSVGNPYRLTAAEARLRRHLAAELESRIRSAATALTLVDADVARRISTAADGVDALHFDGESPAATVAGDTSTPPADSLKGGGHWSVDTSRSYDEPAAVVGPLVPWQHAFDGDDNPALFGRRSAFADVVAANHPGAGAEPVARLQESWQLALTGESFNGSPEHVRWVRENGRWYQARWIDHRFTGIRQRAITTEQEFLAPLDRMGFAGRPQSLSIQDLYRISHQNPRLTLSIPDLCGKPTVIGADAPETAIPAAPVMRASR